MHLNNSKKDIYLQIRDHFKRLIEMEIIKKGEMLPSLRKVAVDLGVNPNTVDRAYRMLEEEQLIDIFPKKGAYVKDRSNKVNKKELYDLKEILTKYKSEYNKNEFLEVVNTLLEEIYDRD